MNQRSSGTQHAAAAALSSAEHSTAAGSWERAWLSTFLSVLNISFAKERYSCKMPPLHFHLHFPTSDNLPVLRAPIQLAKQLQSRNHLSALQKASPFLGRHQAFLGAIWKMHSNDRTQEYSFLSRRKEDYYVSMRLLGRHLFACFHKQNGFIKKQKTTCIKRFCLLPK